VALALPVDFLRALFTLIMNIDLRKVMFILKVWKMEMQKNKVSVLGVSEVR